MKTIQKSGLALASGLMLTLAWPPFPFFPLFFIAWIPLLMLDELCRQSKNSSRSFFGYSYLALLTWNLGTTWWVGNTYLGTGDISSAFAGLFANTANPLLMSIPMVAFHRTRKRFGDTIGYFSLPAYWLTFEFIHLRWDLSWPWLTLGNGLAAIPEIIQWYEWTGTLGGSLWLLAVNILAYRAFRSGVNRKHALVALLTLLVPVMVSLVRYYTYSEKGALREVVLVQPNIDPYNMKFDERTLTQQLETLISLSMQKTDSTTDYLVWPETAIPEGIMLDELHRDSSIARVRQIVRRYPQVKVITGVSAYAKYKSRQTATARVSRDSSFYWDAFNTALQIDAGDSIPVYHKSKLVPGVEKMPYPKLFRFLEPLAIDMGGITGSLGSQDERGVFFSGDETGIAPMICYESIYGEYANGYLRNGAQLFFVITNDGWWGNTAGYKQHLQYARLRALETRRAVAQAANTGISAFINQRGDIVEATGYWVPAVIRQPMHANSDLTLFARLGDVPGRLALGVTLLIAGFSLYTRLKNKLNKK